jgi:hypothetical protein
MRGLQLFGVSALVSNKDASHRQSMGIESVQKPIQVEEHIFGRRRALQAVFGGTVAALIAPAASIALDMDAFMNSEVRQSFSKHLEYFKSEADSPVEYYLVSISA